MRAPPPFALSMILACLSLIGRVLALADQATKISGHITEELEENEPLADGRIRDFQFPESGKKERIHASIVPIVHAGSPPPRAQLRAEVRLHVADPPLQRPPPEDLLRATSLVMEYDEDTRKYFVPKENGVREAHRIRHRFHKALSSPPSPDAANDAPSEEEAAPTPARPSVRWSVPVGAIVHGGRRPSVLPRRRIQEVNKLHAIHNNSWVALHSPLKIYIPIRYRDNNEVSADPASGGCVRCSADLTLTAARGESRAPVPVPAISVCSRLARKRGRMNVAVTSGPRPGVLVTEGHYPVELIIWKPGGYVYSCKYTLTVLVKKCDEISVPDGGSVDCSNGTAWESQCHFTCHAGYVLQGHRTLLCDGTAQKVSWSAPFPTCRKPSNKGSLPAVKGVPCLKLKSPSNGAVVCDSNGKDLYPDGSVCQFFCYPGFLIDQVSSGSSLVVCKNGQWTPNDNVACLAAYCSEPDWPKDGRLKCDQEGGKDSSFRGRYPNGTSCSLQCDIGHVIPTSQMDRSTVVCTAPAWNDSAIPECKRVVPPQRGSEDCRNETLTVGEGRSTLLPPDRLPKFISQGGTTLNATCTLGGKELSNGLHYNFCEATDPELRITTTCRYYVRVQERAMPRPHPRDCKNVTVLTNRAGAFEIKPVRFLLKKSGSSPKDVLFGNCTHKGMVSAGAYINSCTAQDPELNVAATCTYTITVKERACPPLPALPHSSFECDGPVNPSRPPKTICKYVCEEGYIPRLSHRKRMIKTCASDLSWRPSALPSCQRAIPPKPRRGECEPQTMYLLEGETWAKYKMPRFKTSVKGTKARVRCSLNRTLTVGDYLNVCEARDRVLGLSSSCKYALRVRARGCPLPSPIDAGAVTCSEPAVQSPVSVGVTCTYHCDEGHVIPTSLLPYSVKVCTPRGYWNSTVTPTCSPQIPPIASKDSCLNRSVSVQKFSTFRVPVPEFESFGGSLLNVSCHPHEMNDQYGIHEVICTAHDPQLRVSASCVYWLDMKDPDQVAELTREETGCVLPATIENGLVRCNSSDTKLLPQHSVCEVECNENYVVPKSQRHLSAAVCSDTSHWNVSRLTDCVQSEAPLDPGCADHILEIAGLGEASVPLPDFRTVRNTTAAVSCVPEVIADYGSYKVSCNATDEELGTSSSCSFNISVHKPSAERDFSTTTAQPVDTTEIEFTSESTFEPCKSLRMPTKGGVECFSEEGRERCRVSCDDGFAFHSHYELLRKGWIECDGTDGLWDFERTYHTSFLPECLGQSEGLALSVWLGFNSTVEQCGEHLEVQYKSKIRDLLLDRNKMCNLLDCTSFLHANCSYNAKKNRIILAINWTLQASFDPDQYEDHDVPDAETQLEDVLQITQKAFSSEEKFRKELLEVGIELCDDTFDRGHMVLVCPKGYVVDNTDTCVECPSGTMESNAECVTCSAGTFQLLTGQTVCETCPQNAAFFRGNVPLTCAG